MTDTRRASAYRVSLRAHQPAMQQLVAVLLRVLPVCDVARETVDVSAWGAVCGTM